MRCKPIEFPNFGIFVPVMIRENKDHETVKLTEKSLNKFNPADMDVTLLLNGNFLKGCGSSIRIQEGNDSNLISTYDPSLGDHH